MKDILIILEGIAIAICILLLTASSEDSVQSRVLISAAHLGDVDGYTCVYSNEKTDYAVHVKKNYKQSTSLEVGDKVKVLDISGRVTGVDDVGFEIKVSDVSKVVPGVSGSPVNFRESPIGFVSGWNGEGALRCVFY